MGIELDFVQAMRDAGCAPADPAEIVADDTIRRYTVEGDKPRSKNGSYCLAADGDFGYGWFQWFKQPEVHNWHSKSNRKWTAEEKAEHKRKMDAARQKREAQIEADRKTAREEAAAMWAAGARDGVSPYAIRKGVTLKGVRYDGDTLLVPMWRDGVVVAVQRILADGTKLFQRSSDHVGAYFSIRGDLDTIAICEGVSTGATVHEATGWSVICAFNAGNLKPVAKAIRAKYPDARIVFAADNDHETTNAKGEPMNAGLDKAKQASVAIGGAQVLAPDCEAGESDWNDIAARLGVDAVRDALMGAPVVAVADEWDDDVHDERDYDIGPEVVDHDPMSRIRPLGHDRGVYYFFPVETGQIVSMKASELGRPQTLYKLADKDFWLAMYAPETKMGVICDMASAVLMQACHRKGVFSLDSQRGVGVWRDGHARLLVNCGGLIVGEGVRCHPSEFVGRYVYEAGANVIDLECDPLGNTDAARFRDICNRLSWRKRQSGDLLAGWCVVSVVGGALDWRPHIYVTGPKGSGKSTVMDNIVTGAVGSVGIKRDGGTTEAGVRKAIGTSSRPFIMDEAEAESGPRQQQMKLILEYFRNASSGAVVENAYATYVSRSAACFGAINPPVSQGADADRWSMLELMRNTSADRDEHYRDLMADIRALIRPDFAARLLARTVANLDVLLDNIGVFVDVLSKKLGSKRAGDQIGTLLAGTYSLVSNKRVTHAFVEGWVEKQAWDWDDLTGGGSDSDALMQHIMSARVAYDHEGMRRESSIGEMVWRATNDSGAPQEAAARGLGGYGIKVQGDMLVISNTSSRIRELLRDTPWAVQWKQTLGQYTGAHNMENKPVYFGPGVLTKGTAVPLDAALGRDAGEGDEFVLEGFE